MSLRLIRVFQRFLYPSADHCIATSQPDIVVVDNFLPLCASKRYLVSLLVFTFRVIKISFEPRRSRKRAPLMQLGWIIIIIKSAGCLVAVYVNRLGLSCCTVLQPFISALYFAVIHLTHNFQLLSLRYESSKRCPSKTRSYLTEGWSTGELK